MSTRRKLLRALGVGALFARLGPASGQPSGKQPAKIPRIGMLFYGRSPETGGLGTLLARFRQRLAELGYIDGKTIVIDTRYAEGDAQRLQQLARELVANGVDIIVAQAVNASVAARQATSTIPIVMLHAGNPEGAGLIASLARPGGNVTGTSNILIGGKQVQLLREFIPRLAKLAVLMNPGNSGHGPLLADLSAASRDLGIAVTVVEVTRAEDLPRAFAAIRKTRPHALFVMVDGMIAGLRAPLVEFAAGLRLPMSSDGGDIARHGALMSYGQDLLDHYSVGADYVDKILKGAKPADLPVQQAKLFEFLINRKTAKALGLRVPHALLMRADEVID